MKSSSELDSVLPIVEPSVRRHRAKAIFVHTIRVAIFAAILLAIRYQYQEFQSLKLARRLAPEISLEQLQKVLPAASTLKPWAANGSATIVDSTGNYLATAFHTAKESREIVGYVGSTYLLIIFKETGRIENILVLESDDTPEHLAAIVDDQIFWKQWIGLTWNEAANLPKVDTVSGATLTSLAIVQSLNSRLGNSKPSLKFPKGISLEEVKTAWPNAETIYEVEGRQGWFKVTDKSGATVGYFLRSSPMADSIHGYQGPTDFLTFFDGQEKYLKTTIRSSFDNMQPEPFVQYVAEEEYFLVDQFSGLTLQELAELDIDQVEGVSGATMTSQGVFRALQFCAKEFSEVRPPQQKEIVSPLIRWTYRDIGTLVILAAAFLMTFTRLKGKKSLRRAFCWTLFIYLGLVNGDMLAQTLFVGWAQNGVAWENAFGLAMMSLAAILVPVLTKQNIYCQSICPFGAAQTLAGRLKRKKPKTARWIRRLQFVPALLIVLVVFTILTNWNLNLASIEPFDAFSFRVAGWMSIGIATVGLALSVFIPMAYCRIGCPTGAILNFLRRNARSDQIGPQDWLAILILLAVSVRLFV